jgi:poly(ADP-ribose) glycohydrolase ARH3
MPDDEEKRARFRGAFLGCALGDAIGRPFEMMSSRDSRLGRGLDALLSGSTPFAYSDDTQMTISVAESLIRIGSISGEDVLSTLAENYDPARGYGHGMKRALEAFERGNSRPGFSSWAEGSKGNGGAVRIVPVACVYHDDHDLLAALAEDVAGLTHAHPEGRAGAVVHAIALATALGTTDPRVTLENVVGAVLRHRVVCQTPISTKVGMIGNLLEASDDGRAAVHALGNGVLAEEAVPLALFSFLRWAPDFEAVVRNTILCGGDTDTIAAMSGACCGALVGEDALPARWVERLENGPKGTEYLRTLADAAFDLWRARSP